MREQMYHFAPMTEADARAIGQWRYEGPYAIYTTPVEQREAAVLELLDHRSPYLSARDAEGELVGFFAFGSAAEVGEPGEPHLLCEGGLLSVGLGLRPDLTGHGRGLAFVEAGLAYAREKYRPRVFRLFVLSFNVRARRVYERAGFVRVGTARIAIPGGDLEFIEMRREP